MIKTCQNCFGWVDRESCCSILRLPHGRAIYPEACRFWKYKDDVDRKTIEHDIMVYAGLRTKGGD